MSSILQELTYVAGSALTSDTYISYARTGGTEKEIRQVNYISYESTDKSFNKSNLSIKKSITLKQPAEYGKRVERLVCSECSYLPKSQEKLDLHMKIHFATNDQKKKSLQKQKQNAERNYLCSKCNRFFPTQRKLKSHDKTHLKKYEFECLKCPSHFGNEKRLISHQKLHDKKNVDMCLYCLKVFSDNKSLTDHIRLHTGEKPYPCPHCDMKFRIVSGLIIHKRKYHMNMFYYYNVRNE